MTDEQMQFDLWPEVKALAAGLVDPRRMPTDAGGAARLMRQLVRDGLAEDPLRPAAGLVLEMDRQARSRKGRAA